MLPNLQVVPQLAKNRPLPFVARLRLFIMLRQVPRIQRRTMSRHSKFAQWQPLSTTTLKTSSPDLCLNVVPASTRQCLYLRRLRRAFSKEVHRPIQAFLYLLEHLQLQELHFPLQWGTTKHQNHLCILCCWKVFAWKTLWFEYRWKFH